MPNVQVSNQDKDSIVKIVFRVDPEILEWAVKTMGDSHIEIDKNSGAPQIVPNTNSFRCPKCDKVKMKSAMLPPQAYMLCSGVEGNRHEATATEPEHFDPICTAAGIDYLLGSIAGSMNTNFSSANFASSDADTKNGMSLDMRLRLMGWADGVETLATLIGNSNYLTQRAMDNLEQVFTIPFMTKIITTLGWNIYANAAKGKGVGAVNTVATNRIAVEATANTAMRYDYPDSVGAAQKKGLMSQLLSSLGFNKE